MTDAITKMIPTIMAAELAGHNVGYLKRKKKRRSLLGLGMTNIVGTSMIQATAQAGSY